MPVRFDAFPVTPVLGQSSPSAANIKKAAQAFDSGREAYRAESYTEAAEYFESADDFAPRGDTLRLAMLSRRAAGQLDRAMTLAALGLELYGSDEAIREAANEVIAEGAAAHAKVQVACDTPCELLLDDKLVHGKDATSRTLYVTPGTHTLRANWSKQRAESDEFAVVAGDEKLIEFVTPPEPVEPRETTPDTAEPSENTPPPEEEDRGGWSPVVFWTGVGLTGAGIAASAVLGVRALNEPGKDAVEDCTAPLSECQALLDEGKQNEMIANIAIFSTVAVGAFTLVTGIWLTDWDGKKPEASADGFSLRRMEYRHGQFSARPVVAAGDGVFLGTVGNF